MSDAAPENDKLDSKSKTNTDTVLYISSFPPRECGIATFTSDLVTAIDKQFSKGLKSQVLALDDSETHIYNYPKKVNNSIYANDINLYIESAHNINNNPDIKIVSIQHEFGLFGGEYGDYLLKFLDILQKPVIITFHSVLPTPDKKLKSVVEKLSQKTQAFVVMTQAGIDILEKYYDINCNLYLIPHGIPHITYESQERIKKKMSFEDRFIISSFGLLSDTKGYEYVIKALPDLVRHFPNLLYIIVGTTHPTVRKKEGEKYRLLLENLVEKYSLLNNVKFYDKYVDIEELIEFLKATDIYICASQSPDQITSGTLSYALGAGRPVISTAFTHAKDLVTKDCGALTGFGNSKDFKEELERLLSNQNKLKQMGEAAYATTRYMVWSNVALSYGKLFNKYIDSYSNYTREIPKINLKHIKRLTDSFGMIQFANHNTPDLDSGYTLDDNARAAIVIAKLNSVTKKDSYIELIEKYLNVIKYCQSDDGKLYNYISKDKILNKNEWVVDAHARGLWALGNIINLKSCPLKLRAQAREIFDLALPYMLNTDSPRAAAFTILGLSKYYSVHPSDDKQSYVKKLADFLVSCYKTHSSKNWQWFESILAYSNATLVEAIISAYELAEDSKYKEIGLETLNFLTSVTFENDMFIPIGQDSWYKKGSKRSYFDQQPIEADTTVCALTKAYKVFKDPVYKEKAIKAFNWFLGKNSLGQFVYNQTTSGCHDGVGEESLNLNQGAESTLAYLHAALVIDEL